MTAAQKGQAHSAISGQALIEILVALTVMVLVATAFVTLGVVTVRNSSFSQNKTRATQLAQEGIEAVITIRDQNAPGAILNNGTYDQWVKLFNQGTTCSPPDPNDPTYQCPDTDYFLRETPCLLSSPGDPTPKPQRCIERSATGAQLSATNDIFRRKIRITDTADPSEATTVRAVNVFVWWTDSQGLHKAVVTRKVHKNRLGDLM